MASSRTLVGAATRTGAGIALAAVVMAVAALARGALPQAAPDPNAQTPGHAEQKCQLHGGQVSTSRQHFFETVFDRDGVRVFLYAADLNPMPVGRATGSVRFEFKDGSTTEVPLMPQKPRPGEPTVYYCSMHPSHVQTQPGQCPQCGMDLISQYSLAGKADLARASRGGLKAVISIRGMPGDEPAATFTASTAEARGPGPEPAREPVPPKTRPGARRSG